MTTPDASMSGRICLVTGATAGIGAAAARELVRRGAAVILVGRNRERCVATADSIRREQLGGSVEYLCADLSSRAEVQRLAEEFRAGHQRLDVLVNNAGAVFAVRRESIDGIEMTLALNHLAPFLLTNLLLDRLQASAPARIINVSSSAHEDVAAFDFDDPQARARGGGPRRAYPRSELGSLLYSLTLPWAHPGFIQYAQTKLANVLFTQELGKRLAGTGVTVNAVDPGLVASSFAAGNGTYGWFMRCWSRLRGISPEEGAESLVYLATSPEVQGVSGQYFVNRRPAASSAASRDPTAAQRLWKLSEELTGLRAMDAAPRTTGRAVTPTN